jgi:hypothetical protein
MHSREPACRPEPHLELEPRRAGSLRERRELKRPRPGPHREQLKAKTPQRKLARLRELGRLKMGRLTMRRLAQEKLTAGWRQRSASPLVPWLRPRARTVQEARDGSERLLPATLTAEREPAREPARIAPSRRFGIQAR